MKKRQMNNQDTSNTWDKHWSKINDNKLQKFLNLELSDDKDEYPSKKS